MLLGRLELPTAVGEAFQRTARPRDQVRYTTAGRLRRAGFRPVWDGHGDKPNHVSVEFRGLWDDYVARRFEDCFD